MDWLNEIVERYEGAGGWFGENDTAQLVINRLSYAGGAYGLPMMSAGTGVRLVPVHADAPPAGKRWAFWNVINNRFDLWRGPAPQGVKVITHFKRRHDGTLHQAAALRQATRQVVAQRRVSPPARPVAAGGPSVTSRLAAPSLGAVGIANAWGAGSTKAKSEALAPPGFEPPGGQYSPSDFKLRVHLVNPNAADATQVYYSIDNSGWTRYGGEAIVVAPGAEVLAFCTSAEAGARRDSEPVAANYTIEPIRLELTVSQPADTLPAGALRPGGELSPLLPEVAVSNIEALPDELRTGEHFQILWTVDGSDPLTSTTAFPLEVGVGLGEAQPLPISDLLTGGATKLLVRIAARSSDRRLLLDSAEASLRLEIVQ